MHQTRSKVGREYATKGSRDHNANAIRLKMFDNQAQIEDHQQNAQGDTKDLLQSFAWWNKKNYYIYLLIMYTEQIQIFFVYKPTTMNNHMFIENAQCPTCGSSKVRITKIAVEYLHHVKTRNTLYTFPRCVRIFHVVYIDFNGATPRV